MQALFVVNQPWDRVSAIRQNTWSTSARVFGGVTGIAGLLQQRTSSPILGIYDGAPLDAVGAVLGQDQVVYEKHAGANSAIAIDAGTETTGNTGTNLPGGITLFSALGGGAYGNARCYRLIMRDTPFTTEERATAETWVTEAITVTDPLGDAGVAALTDLVDWRDPTRTDLMFQSHATLETNADAHGDPVGLQLDRSQFGMQTFAEVMAAQPNLADGATYSSTNPAFSNTATGFQVVGATPASGVSVNSSSGIDGPDNKGVAGKLYYVELTISDLAGDNVTFRPWGGGNVGALSNDSYAYFIYGGAAQIIRMIEWGGGLTDVTVDVSIKRAPGS
jgi:hypothetical protein